MAKKKYKSKTFYCWILSIRLILYPQPTTHKWWNSQQALSFESITKIPFQYSVGYIVNMEHGIESRSLYIYIEWY